MKVSPEVIRVIKHHEGVKFKPYRCPALLWTVGVGHVIDPSHISVPIESRKALAIPEGWDRVLTPDEVDKLLTDDLRRFEQGVLRLCPTGLNQSRFDALVSFAFNVGQPSYVSDIWTNTTVAYDVAIGGLPFFYGINNDRPYERQTAPYKKQQFDNSKEPGEQTLEGWWIRSQSSFHRGAGITFFDPSAGEEVDYRFSSSQGVNVWDKGQVTLLKKVVAGHETSTSSQKLRSIRYSNTDAVLSLDGHDVDKLLGDGTVVHFVDYNSGTDAPVYGICDDGTTAYWATINACCSMCRKWNSNTYCNWHSS